jgi:hypothetical protein
VYVQTDLRPSTQVASVNTLLTMYDDIAIVPPFKVNPPGIDEHEAARLKENVAFWREKVDLLLQEKKESLAEGMRLHTLIRGFEDQVADFKV